MNSSTRSLAAATKSLQSCPTLCDHIDGSPSGSSIPEILQARTLEWVAISISNAWKWKAEVKLINPVGLLATPWTAAYQAPPSMGFSRQEYWSGVPLLASTKAPVVSEKWCGGSVFLEEPLSFEWDLSNCSWSQNPTKGSRWASFQICPRSWSHQVSGNRCQCRLPFTTSPGPSFQRYPWWAGSVLTNAERMFAVTGDVSRWPVIAYSERC